MAALEQTCARPPTPQVAWVHQIHSAGRGERLHHRGYGVSLGGTLVMSKKNTQKHNHLTNTITMVVEPREKEL